MRCNTRYFFTRSQAICAVRAAGLGLLALLVAGCVGPRAPMVDRGEYYVDNQHVSQSQDQRVKFLIMHYTAVNERESLDLLTRGVASAHYLVPEKPEMRNGKPVVLQLVAEEQRAWHAGISNWNGRTNLNDSSIGIENVNLGFRDGGLGTRIWYPYSDAQIMALAALAKDIIRRHQIAPENVLGHSDIAPLRKQDPGALFPWRRLALMGIGAWPDEQTVRKYLAGRELNAPGNVREVQSALRQYGYDNMPQTGVLDAVTRVTIGAFQMHFRPADIAGNADAETEAIAKALVEKYRAPSLPINK